jgi:hypothetical protein
VVVDKDFTIDGIIETFEEFNDGGFAGTGVADEGNSLAGFDFKGEILQDGL